MKKSASGAAATRIRPSAPTPRWRSQIAAISAASRDCRPSRSSMRTKSFPVPLYFPNRISVIAQIPQELLRHGDRPSLVGVEPPDPGIAAEPRHLPPGQFAGPLHDPAASFLEGDPTRDVLDRLSVPDGLPGGEGRAAVHLEERAGLEQQPVLELPPDAPIDPLPEHV